MNIQELCKSSPKLEALYQSVLRKGLITENGVITLAGKEVLGFLNRRVKKDMTLEKPTIETEDFDKWWHVYPGTDTFVYNDKSFVGTRSLRVRKDECRSKFNKILLEGEYTAEELIKALNYEVDQKKSNSYKTRENKLTYMQNSLTYLNQRSFEPFIELIRDNKMQQVALEKQEYDGINL